ncbi:hypothetical protein Rsub_09378 [Raphidocelis subcapitata]|uniref:Uncharacterized protein n=1 Tax=Raphidocelis subcapitata TaxID=307507 RepID=A0A2V0PCG5_9CHLO|nr:hypothetical protein Rsub_09378 [Raphidocelis subcapitata]|eukprot:GBF96632.1 hypothetical protein Rsub_09378 [Raphidocelis subcapitata]
MQMQLSATRGASGAFARPQGRSASARKAVLVRAKEMREYREDTGEVSVPGQDKKDDAALFADQVKAARKPQDNMSKEMKDRLRKEYVSFGGAENTAMSNNYFLWIAVIVAVLAVMSKMIGAI